MANKIYIDIDNDMIPYRCKLGSDGSNLIFSIYASQMPDIKFHIEDGTVVFYSDLSCFEITYEQVSNWWNEQVLSYAPSPIENNKIAFFLSGTRQNWGSNTSMSWRLWGIHYFDVFLVDKKTIQININFDVLMQDGWNGSTWRGHTSFIKFRKAT